MKKEPAYLEIYYKLRDAIVKKAYAYGQKLPSKRALADQMHVSVITIGHSYELLVDEGYAEARERSGYYVSYNDADPFLAQSAQGKEEPQKEEYHENFVVPPVPDFSFNSYARAVRKVLNDDGEQLFVKSENQGRYDLRQAIASYLMRNRGMNVSPGQILVGSGAEYLYGMAVAMLGRDRIYAVENPSYEMIEKIYHQNGVTVEKLKMGPDGILSSELLGAHASVLHVTPFHSYPSGVTADATRRAEYVNWARRRGGFIVEDDYDSEFTVKSRREDTLFSMEPMEHIIYINTFSRTISHATRIGYMVLPSEYASDMLSKVDFYSCTVPVLDQAVLRELLNSGEFERHINRVRRQLKK
ncbi:MAG: PLP-dependent aminotransferase family protein [Lachnospiraceae bacterium]|nr:PLP-dependent aminotransferase family protein [Lachnospiraceae bacterium]